MEQLAMLWEYQAEDMKADKLANDIRRNPLRQKLENDRTQYMERQKQYKQLEEQIAVMTDRKDAIRDAVARCADQLKALQTRYEANPPQDVESARAMLAEAMKCRETISSYEKEVKRIAGDATNYEQKSRSIRHDAAKLRAEFEQLKLQYDKEMPEKKAALEAQRAVAKAKSVGIDEELLSQYQSIKKHITPPIARLVGDQCSGCNTSLPSAVLRRVRSANLEVVECETCGRMIIQ